MVAASIIPIRALSLVEGAIEGWVQVLQSPAAYGRIAACCNPRRSISNGSTYRAQNARSMTSGYCFLPQGTKRIVLNRITFALSRRDWLSVIGNLDADKTTLGKMLVRSTLVTSRNVRLDLMDLRN